MGFIDFKGTVKKASLKPDGDVEIVLTASGNELRGKIEGLHEMLGSKVSASFDSMIVNYNIEINARTNKPVKHYKVDEKGVVSEVMPEGEQLSMDKEIGLEPEKDEIKNEPAEIDRNIIDEFILSGLAPAYEEFPLYFPTYIERLNEGETYIKFANELGMSSGRIAEIFDEYRKRIAPHAVKWDEWRQGKIQAEPAAKEEEKAASEPTQGEPEQQGKIEEAPTQSDAVEFESDEVGMLEEGNAPEVAENAEEQGTEGAAESASTEVDKEALEQYILEHRPAFDEIPIDFPSLLEERLNLNKTWREIANEAGMTSGQLSSKWSAYKKRAAEKMKDGGAA